MTDQKITTYQDLLVQPYEEIERLHKLIVTIALATDGQDAREIALKELGWSSVAEDTIQTVGKVREDKKPLPCGDKWYQHFSECEPAGRCLYPVEASIREGLIEAQAAEIEHLQKINAKLDSNCEAAIRKLQAAHRMLMRHGVPCKSSDYVEAIVEEETIEGLKTVIVNASGLTLSCTICSKPIYNGTSIGEGIIAGLEEAVEHASQPDLGPRWSKKS